MTGFIYSIAFNLTGQSSVAKAVELTDRLDRSVNKVRSDVGGMGTAAQRAGQQASRGFDQANSSLRTWITSIGVGIGLMASLGTAAQVEGFEQGIRFTNAAEGGKNIEFVRQTSDALGLSLQASFEGFQKLQGGLLGTNITAQQSRDIFYSVGEAAAVMRLNGEQTNGVFLALSQIASKGNVQAEELRGQLGERLPGAFAIAARSLGVTTSQLNKMLEQGQVLSEDFLPKFAAELHKTFGSGVATAVNSASANFNRLNSTLFNLKDTVGRELLPVVIPLLENYIVPGITWIAQHAESILKFVAATTALYAIVKTVSVAVQIWTGVQWLLNAAMWANPIGLVVLLIAALIGVVIWAAVKFDTLRGVVLGAGMAMVEVGKWAWEKFIQPLVEGAKILINFFGKIWEGVVTLGKALFSWLIEPLAKLFDIALDTIGATELGQKAGAAFTEGFDKGKNLDFSLESLLGSAGKAFSSPDALSAAFATVPGATAPGGGGPGGGSGLNIRQGVQGITSGGGRNVTINATFGDNIIHAATAGAGIDELKEKMTRTLLQVLNSANQNQ